MTTSVFLLVPDLARCGDTVAARVLALGLPSDRFRVTVGVLGPPGAAAADELEAAGIAVRLVPIRHIFDLNGVRRLRAAARESGAAIIHAWGPIAARLARLIVTHGREGENTPRLIVSGAAGVGSGLYGWLTVRQLRRADRVVATTRADGDRYHRLGVRSESLTLIGPAVPTPVAAPDRATLLASLGVPQDSRLIVSGGKSERGIGPKDAIVVFDMLRYENRDLHLVVFGAEPAARALEQFGRALAFDDFRVRFAPTGTDRAAAVQLATIVLVTDPHGGVGEALEAMAAGKAVVGWNTPELREVVAREVFADSSSRHGATGILVPMGDRAALAAAARGLLEAPTVAVRMGEAGRERAREHFGASRMVEQFERLYTHLSTG